MSMPCVFGGIDMTAAVTSKVPTGKTSDHANNRKACIDIGLSIGSSAGWIARSNTIHILRVA